MLSVGRCCRSSGGVVTHLALTHGWRGWGQTTRLWLCRARGSPAPRRDRQAGDAAAGVGPGLKLCGPAGPGSPKSGVQAEHPAQAGIPASRRAAGGLGDKGPPAAAQPVNGSPHPPMPHLTTCCKTTACGERTPAEPPAWRQPRLHPTAQGPSCPPWGASEVASGQGGTARRPWGTVALVLGVTREQGIHPPAPGGMERAAVLAPVIAAEAAEGLAHHSDPCQAAPAGPAAVHRASSLRAGVGVRGLGGPGDGQGTSAFPPLPVLLLGKLRHRQAFPPACTISGALCTPGLCWRAPGHTQSGDTHGRHTRCTHVHTHPCTHAAPLL